MPGFIHSVARFIRQRMAAIPLLALLAYVATAPVHAGDAGAKTADFNIGESQLADALSQFGAQSGLQVVYQPEVASGLESKALSGRLTADAALKQLLAGTDVTWSYVNGDTVVLKRGGAKKEAKPVHTVQEEQSTANRPSLESSAELQEIVVTAQKREERLDKVPMSISVLSGTSLANSTFDGVTEALATIPSVATTKNYQGGGTLVAIRGVAAGNAQFQGSSPIAYYLDGVPFGLIKTAIAPDQSVYDLKQIEVLRGPQGTLYGASAEGGVVRVLTNEADLDNVDFSARGMVYGTQRGGGSYGGDVMLNLPIVQGALAARAVLGYERDAGWIDQPNEKDVNDSELTNYRLKLAAEPVAGLSLGLTAWRSRDSSGAPSFGHEFDESSALLPQPQSTDFDAYGFNAGYQAPWFSVSNILSYLDYSNRGILDLGPFGAPGATWFVGLGSRVLSNELYLSSTSQDRWRWSLGGMYRRVTERNFQTYTELPVPTTDYRNTSKSYAIFAELTRVLMDGKFEVTVGGRHFHDDISQRDQNAPGTPFIEASSEASANTPRVLLAWYPVEQRMFYASYSEGFRSGFPQNANVPASFAPLQPDKLKNYEVGSKGGFGDGGLRYDTAVYYIDWVDVQQTITVPFGGVPYPALVNGEGASGMGAELGLTVEAISGLTLGVNMGWNELQMKNDVRSGDLVLFSKGDRLNFSPETTAGASAAYQFNFGASGLKGTFSLAGTYTSSQIFRLQLAPNFATAGKGDPIVQSRAALLIESPNNWTATLFIDNLNNQRGTPAYAPVGVVNWSARVRPRTFGIQFGYHLR